MIEKIQPTINNAIIKTSEKVLTELTGKAKSGIQSLENMPEKRDLVQPKVIVRGSASHPGKAVFGLEGFPEEVLDMSKKVKTKLAKYLNILPEGSKLKEPLLFNINNTPFEMMIDKTKKKNTYVTLKQFIPAEKVLKNKNEATILNIELNKDGQMVEGSLMLGNSTVSEAYRFYRSPKNIRRINYEQVYKDTVYNRTLFRPESDSTTWTYVKDNLNRCGSEVPGLNSGAIADDPLGLLFFELTGLKNKI